MDQLFSLVRVQNEYYGTFKYFSVCMTTYFKLIYSIWVYGTKWNKHRQPHFIFVLTNSYFDMQHFLYKLYAIINILDKYYTRQRTE